MFNVVFVFGGPACGKTSLCKKLEDYNDKIIHISVGQLLMEEIGKNTPDGHLIKHHIEQCIIVPPKVTFDILLKELNTLHLKTDDTILLDGYPRDIENYMYYKQNAEKHGMNLTKVLYFSCPNNIMMERSYKRNKTTIRVDSDMTQKRIEAFHKVTVPMIKGFPNHVLIEIDCSDSLEENFAKIKTLF